MKNKRRESVLVDIKGMGSTLPFAVGIDDAAKLIGVSRPTIYKLIRTDEFPTFKIGERTMISVDGLKAWVEEQCAISGDNREEVAG